jgi:hypothetical protein
LKEAYQSKLNAQNDKEKIAADERIAVLQAQRDAITSSEHDPLWNFTRFLFAFPFTLYVNKLVIWDKILGYGSTDNLSVDLWNMFYIILGGYFITQGVKIWKRT